MVRFSPRTYIFEGLQLIRQPLRNFIWEIFKSSDEDWWYKYIYNLLNENKYYRGKVPISGKYTDLSQLDVLYYFKIIERNPKLFRDVIDIEHIVALHRIRNDCVHICREFIIFDKNIADDLLSEMAKTMEKMDHKCCKKLSSLRRNLHKQEYNNKKIVAAKKELVDFLYNNIWKPSFDMLDGSQTIDNNLRGLLECKMWDAYGEISAFETAEEVEQWFVGHLYSKEGIEMFNKLKSIKEIELPTFEDNRKAFMQLCYGE